MRRLLYAFILILGLAGSAVAQVGVLKNTTITAVDQSTAVKVDGIQSVGIDVVGAGTYTLTFQGSMDNGATYFTLGAVDSSDYSRDTTATAPGKWWLNNYGLTHIRVYATSYTSGTPVVRIVRGYGGVTVPLSAGSLSGANDAAGATGAAVPSSASYTGLNIGGNLVGQTGIAVGSHKAGAVQILDNSGNAIVSFGGGTQYTEGDVDATITGTALLVEGAGNALVAAPGTAADGLLVNLGANNDVVATNAGTFAVQESGAALTALQLIDNIVSGAGVNITQLGGASIPMITTQADGQALSTDAMAVASFNYCYNGSTLDLCRNSTGGSGTIDSNTTRVTIATDDPVNDFAVKGDANMVAHDAADAGNPLKIGAKASTGNAARTPVANSDRTDLYADADGVLQVRLNSPLADRVSAVVGVTDGSSTSLVSAQGAGIRFCATAATVSNSSATNVTVDLRDGTAGSVIWTFPASANMGGATLTFPTPLCTSANTALAMDPSASATTVTVSIIGFKTAL